MYNVHLYVVDYFNSVSLSLVSQPKLDFICVDTCGSEGETRDRKEGKQAGGDGMESEGRGMRYSGVLPLR